MAGKALYERDFYSWAFNQANLLRQGRFEQLDLGHLVEEVVHSHCWSSFR